MSTLQEIQADIAADVRCIEQAQGDVGLEHDLRLLTRRSMPTFGRHRTTPRKRAERCPTVRN